MSAYFAAKDITGFVHWQSIHERITFSPEHGIHVHVVPGRVWCPYNRYSNYCFVRDTPDRKVSNVLSLAWWICSWDGYAWRCAMVRRGTMEKRSFQLSWRPARYRTSVRSCSNYLSWLWRLHSSSTGPNVVAAAMAPK
jgi:hypothetical protein